MTVGGGWRWQSATWTDYSFLGVQGVGRAEQPSYGVADLMLQLPLTPQLTLSANLYNVFDKKYQAISTSAYYGEARNLRVALAMKF
ncbi:FhuE receptor precursor [compost metagenome]